MRLAFVLVFACVSAHAFKVTGVVNDPAGNPVAGAHVFLNQDRTPKKTDSAPDGKFAFDNVAVGPVEMAAWKEGFAFGGLDARVAGDADVTLTLATPGTITVHLLERQLDPRTRAAGPPHPVVGARVLSLFVNSAFHITVDDLAQLGFPNPRSGDDGTLTIANLPKGGYVAFTIAHREFAEQRVVPYPVDGKVLTLQMFRGITLRGRTTNEAKEGVAKTRISILRSGVPPLKEYKEVQSDVDGYYEAMVEPGDFVVVAKHQDYAFITPAHVHVDPGAEEANCDVTLAAGHKITGQLLSKDGKPLGGVTVQYVVEETVYDESLSDVHGNFALTVASGTGKVHVVAPDGYITDRGTDVEIKVISQDVALKDPIHITELPVITGTITDETGAPQKDTIIASLNLDPQEWTTADEHGNFALRLTKAPEEGTAQFRAEHTRRFLRQDFAVSFADLQPQQVKLAEFAPNLRACDQKKVKNQLDGFRDRKAPAINCKPWFNLPATSDGKPATLTLEGLKGKVVCLIFWGGFDTTPIGVTRLRQMNTFYEAFRDTEDVVFVGIHDSSSLPDEVRDYLEKNDVKYPVGIDNETATFDLYDIFSIPQIVLIDKKGVLRFYDVEGRLLELIKSLRREAP